MLSLGAIATGSMLLLLGGHVLVSACIQLAYRMGISPAIASATLVAIGTSFPEIGVCLLSPAANIDVAVGNVVGSNIQNIAVVLGCSCLIYRVRLRAPHALQRWSFTLLASAVAYVLLHWPMLQPIGGAVLLFGFCCVLIHTLRSAKTSHTPETPQKITWSLPKSIAGLITGLISLVAGGKIVVIGAVEIASHLGIPQQIVGLSIVAFGTSLPELAFSLAALRQNHHDVALGNILGSNLYNILLGLGVVLWPAKVSHLSPIDPVSWALLFGYTLILYPAIRIHGHLSRWFGLLLVIPYAIYTLLLWQQ
ncbi:MAG: calcium/sodium antiporter [Myxococcota bacterium]